MMLLVYILLMVGFASIAFVMGAIQRRKVIEWSRIASFLRHYHSLIKENPKTDLKKTKCGWYKDECLIWAHAGGADPVLYGNAQENFDRAIAKGFKCLEADVGITSDGVPVMTHLFRPNFENIYMGVPTSKEFLNTLIADKYTPLTLESFLSRYRDFDGYIFLDGLNFSRRSRFNFRKYFSKIDEEIKQKIIVQVFKFDDLLSLKMDNPFGGIHFSGISGLGTNKYIRPLLIKALKSCGVKSVSISDFEIVGKDIANVVGDFRRAGMVVSVAGVNALSYYRRLRKIGVNCIDSDYLTPNEVKGVE